MSYTPEQLQAIESDRADILVAASAGSGKTEIMTQRAARLLLSGVAPESMAIVTFTTGAEAEMKARLAAILTERQGAGRKGAAALNLLKSVKIGTLHSFCRAVIRQFFWKIGVDPNFAVADEGKAAALRRSAAGKTLEMFLEKDAPGFAELTDRLAYMRGDEALKDLIIRISETAYNGPDPGAWLQKRYEEAGGDGGDGAHEKYLLQAAEEYGKQYARLKSERGLMDFSDLENKTLEILRDADALAEARRIWRYIFVDEYQDINPAQEQIVSALGEGGNLFLVGDPKQSIYGFRACDSRIFVNKSLDTARREVIRLNANFRSRPEILDFCNDVFSGLMTREAGGVDYAGEAMFVSGLFSQIKPVTDNTEYGMQNAELKDGEQSDKKPDNTSQFSILNSQLSDFELLNLEKADCKNNSPKILVSYGGGAAEEAELIANEIETLRSQGYKYADIVILTRWLSSAYARALSAALTARGVPLSLPRLSDTGDGFLLDLLRVADNRRQDIPLAAVMRGAFFGFTDGELARIRLFAPDEEFFYEAVFKCAGAGGGLGEKTAAFLRELDALSRAADALPAAEFIDFAARRYRYRDYLAAGAAGAADAARFENFLRRARGNGQVSLSEFLLRLEEEESGGGAEPVPASGAVRLTTVHRSKGAQYPAVILAGTGKPYINRDARRPALVDLAHGLALKPILNGHFESCRYESILNALYAAELSEEVRVLYVALTRAKERLIVTGCIREKDADGDTGGRSALKWLLANRSPRCEYIFSHADNAADSLNAECNGHFSLSQPVIDCPSKENSPTKKEISDGELLSGHSEQSENSQSEIVDCKKPELLNSHFDYPYAADLLRPAKTTATALNNAQFSGQSKKEKSAGKFFSGHNAQLKGGAINAERNGDERNPSETVDCGLWAVGCERPELLNSQFSIFNAKDVGTAYHAALTHIGELSAGKLTSCRAEKTPSETVGCGLWTAGCKRSELLDSRFSILISFLDSLLARNLLTAAQRAAIDPAVLALYFQSPLPDMLSRAEKIYRERNFIYDDDGMIVQGRLDLLLAGSDGLTVVDYKLSGGPPEVLRARYAAQIRIYARAAADILGKPVKAAYLYHIDTGKLILMS